MRDVYNNFIYAELLESNPLDDVVFYGSFSGWHDTETLKFAKIILSNTMPACYHANDIVLVHPSKIIFYETENRVLFRNDAIVCGYDWTNKKMATFNYDVMVKIDETSTDDIGLTWLNASINEAEVFYGTVADIYENDQSGVIAGDKVIVAQTNPKIDVASVPFEFKKLSDKNGKYVVTDTRNIIARL